MNKAFSAVKGLQIHEIMFKIFLASSTGPIFPKYCFFIGSHIHSVRSGDGAISGIRAKFISQNHFANIYRCSVVGLN